MKYLKTKHERNSAKMTTLIVVILLLLCFVVGQTYQDPPEEYGVAVNFGNSAVGSGNTQPEKPVKSKNLNKQPQEPQKEAAEPQETSNSETSKENVLTQEKEEALAIKKVKEDKKAKEKAVVEAKKEADRIAKEKELAVKKKRQEEAKKKAELDAIMGGMNTSNGDASGNEGNDNQAGDKGQLDGNPYAPSSFGNGSGNGGVGYGLNGRGKPTKKVFKQNCNESGLVVVRIEVDRNGNVVKAEPGVKGTENTAPCLLAPAKKIAISHKWKANAKAPTRQVGFVSIDFKLGQ